MLKIPATVQLFVGVAPVDMRKHADGISALVTKCLAKEPLSGDIFIFFNGRRDIVRMLFWDTDGFWELSKRLERGRYRKLTANADGASVTVTVSELTELLRAVTNPTRLKKIYH